MKFRNKTSNDIVELINVGIDRITGEILFVYQLEEYNPEDLPFILKRSLFLEEFEFVEEWNLNR